MNQITRGRSRPVKLFRSGTVRCPVPSNPQIPILLVLSGAKDGEMRTSDVLRELRNSEWYGESLRSLDFRGVYPHSHKSIFDTTIKFARKDLTLKRQLFPIGEECKQGWWKLTPLGRERAVCDGQSWAPKFTIRAALVEIVDAEESR